MHVYLSNVLLLPRVHLFLQGLQGLNNFEKDTAHYAVKCKVITFAD